MVLSSMAQSMGVYATCGPAPASGAFVNILPLRPSPGSLEGSGHQWTGDKVAGMGTSDFSLCKKEV